MLLANLEQYKKDIGSLERTYVKISPLMCINDMVTLLIFFVDFLISFIVVFCCLLSIFKKFHWSIYLGCSLPININICSFPGNFPSICCVGNNINLIEYLI